MFPSTHYQHSGKAPVGGVLLTLIGGLMAGVLLGATCGFLIPYCEETKQWTTESILPDRFGPLDEAPKVDSPNSLLQALRPDSDAAATYTEVAVATAEDSGLRYVSVNSVSVETDKDGKDETEKTNVVKNMLFDRDSFERLLQLGSAATA